MKKTLNVAGIAVVALLAGAPVFAQTILTGIDGVDDDIDDINDAVAEELARSEDASRFGNPEYRPGMSGSASLGYSGKTGNNDSQELSAGARLRFAQGQFVQTISAALDYAEANGVSTKEDVFGVYDANYYLNDSFYVFGLGRVESNGLATSADDKKIDAFVGFGPGYRILNTDQVAWRVQAGVGVTYSEFGDGDQDTEIGYIASSRFFYGFNENVFMTNDTDILTSDAALRINNDLGVNFKMTDSFSTRVSYLVEYDDSRPIETDNKLGVALVYGF